MRVNFGDVSIFGIASFCVSVGACVYTYISNRRSRKNLSKAFDDSVDSLRADQDKRLKRFDRTVEELEQMDVEPNLSAEIQEKIMYDVATKAIETETFATQKRIRDEYSVEILKAARDEAETCRRSMEPWVKSSFEKEIQRMDLRSEKSAIVQNVTYDLKKECRSELDAFIDECKADVKRVRDTCSDSASEVYKVAKDIREKAMK